MPRDSSFSVDRYGLSSAPVEREQYVPRIIDVKYTEGSSDKKWSSREFSWTKKLEVIFWVSIFFVHLHSYIHVLICFLATFRSVTKRCLEITRFDLTREKSSMQRWVALMFLFWCQLEEERVWHIRSLYLQYFSMSLLILQPISCFSLGYRIYHIQKRWKFQVVFSKLFSNIFLLQLPALICQGITLVISPLVSLIQDQIMNLLQVNTSATPRDSTVSSASLIIIFIEDFFFLNHGYNLQANIPAASLSAGMEWAEQLKIFQELSYEHSKYKLLYVTPEKVAQ